MILNVFDSFFSSGTAPWQQLKHAKHGKLVTTFFLQSGDAYNIVETANTNVFENNLHRNNLKQSLRSQRLFCLSTSLFFYVVPWPNLPPPNKYRISV